MGVTQVHCSSVQVQPAEARKPWWSGRHRCWPWCGVAAVIVVSLAVSGFCLHETLAQGLRHYSVAIDSVSGLDPGTDLVRRPAALDPEFNLTLRVASSGIWATECAELGMYVEVSYRGIALASSVALTERICAGPKKATEKAIVARGAGVVVPGSVLGSLVMEMRRGEQVFDVGLHGRGGEMDMPCGPIAVGDAGSLERVCWYS